MHRSALFQQTSRLSRILEITCSLRSRTKFTRIRPLLRTPATKLMVIQSHTSKRWLRTSYTCTCFTCSSLWLITWPNLCKRPSTPFSLNAANLSMRALRKSPTSKRTQSWTRSIQLPQAQSQRMKTTKASFRRTQSWSHSLADQLRLRSRKSLALYSQWT